MDDRVSRYPGRVKMVPVPGQPNVYDMTLADEPTVAGTKINKANLLSDTVASSLGGVTTPNLALRKLKQLVDAAQNSANSASAQAKMITGSYVGSGGTSKKITFSRNDVMLLIINVAEEDMSMVIGDVLHVFVRGGGPNNGRIKSVTWSNNSVTFTANYEYDAATVPGVNYKWLAICGTV